MYKYILFLYTNTEKWKGKILKIIGQKSKCWDISNNICAGTVSWKQEIKDPNKHRIYPVHRLKTKHIK